MIDALCRCGIARNDMPNYKTLQSKARYVHKNQTIYLPDHDFVIAVWRTFYSQLFEDVDRQIINVSNAVRLPSAKDIINARNKCDRLHPIVALRERNFWETFRPDYAMRD